MTRAFNIDCMGAMSNMKDNEYDLAIVDPPYGIGVDEENIIKNNSDRHQAKAKRRHEWDSNAPDELYFRELERVSKEQIIWGGNYFLDYLGYCKAPIIWNKKNGGSMYADGEMAWTSRGLPKNLKIWTHQWCGAFKDSERGANYFHPTTKPIALYKWVLNTYAREGDRILDTHLGSGSSRIAAHDMGYYFTGFEIDKEYYNAQEMRFNTHIQQQTMFKPDEMYGGGDF